MGAVRYGFESVARLTGGRDDQLISVPMPFTDAFGNSTLSIYIEQQPSYPYMITHTRGSLLLSDYLGINSPNGRTEFNVLRSSGDYILDWSSIWKCLPATPDNGYIDYSRGMIGGRQILAITWFGICDWQNWDQVYWPDPPTTAQVVYYEDGDFEYNFDSDYIGHAYAWDLQYRGSFTPQWQWVDVIPPGQTLSKVEGSYNSNVPGRYFYGTYSDPPRPLRQVQRDDGLGRSVVRARGASSVQFSNRQRGYR